MHLEAFIPFNMSASLAPPRFIEPQLSKIAEKAPAGGGWAHEIKYDGYRLAARIVRNKAQLLTWRGLDRPLSLHCRCA
jgi:ATP-dependent DNA ligase